MTEPEATKRWCPFVDARGAMLDPVRQGATHCLKGGCAAWIGNSCARMPAAPTAPVLGAPVSAPVVRDGGTFSRDGRRPRG